MDNDRVFIENAKHNITHATAVNLAKEIGVPAEKIEYYLSQIGRDYLDQFREYFDREGQIDWTEEEVLQDKITTVPRFINRTSLPGLVSELDLKPERSRDALNIPSRISFQELVTYVREQIGAVDKSTPLPDTPEILKLLSQYSVDKDGKVPKHLQNAIAQVGTRIVTQEKSLSPRDKKIMITSMYLANYVWQLAKLNQFCLEQRMYQQGLMEEPSKRLNNWQIDTFSRMMVNAFAEYSGRFAEDPMAVLLMVTLKIFQDLNEFIS